MGWNGSGGGSSQSIKGKPKARQSSRLRSIVYGLMLMALAIAGVFLVFSRQINDNDDTAPKSVNHKIKVVDRAKANFSSSGESNPKLRKALEALSKKADPVEIKRVELAEKFAKLPHNYKPIFNNSVEQILSWICETEPGEMPFPMPELEGEELQNLVFALLEKNEVKDTDSDEHATIKENLKQAKAEMLKYIKAGGDPNEFLQYHNKQLIRAFELRQEAIQQIFNINLEDKPLAVEFLQKVNKELESEGIKPITTEEASIDEAYDPVQ